jgi:hypothetical protein
MYCSQLEISRCTTISEWCYIRDALVDDDSTYVRVCCVADAEENIFVDFERDYVDFSLPGEVTNVTERFGISDLLLS